MIFDENSTIVRESWPHFLIQALGTWDFLMALLIPQARPPRRGQGRERSWSSIDFSWPLGGQGANALAALSSHSLNNFSRPAKNLPAHYQRGRIQRDTLWYMCEQDGKKNSASVRYALLEYGVMGFWKRHFVVLRSLVEEREGGA